MFLTANNFFNLISSCLLLLSMASQSHIAKGEEIIVTDEYGILTDGSGKDHSYTLYADMSWILSPLSLANLDPPSSRVITIEFQAVSFESCCDKVKVFAGNDTESAPVALITGQNITTVTVRGYEQVVVQFTSDSSVVRDGFTAIWYAGETTPAELVGKCPDDCFGQGDCVDGKCICDWGYAGGNCKNSDHFRLREIYNSCNGPNWFNSEGWAMTENKDICYNVEIPDALDNAPSELYGVSCYAEKVTTIDLGGNNIDCGANQFPALPSAVESLVLQNNRIKNGFATSMPETLLVIDLHNVSLSVPLQAAMRNPFRRLGGLVSRLDLSNNKLTGEIGSIFNRFSNIQTLNLENNELVGFPAQHAVLPSLHDGSVRLSNNRFFCPLPLIPSFASVSCQDLILTGVDNDKGLDRGGGSVAITASGFDAATLYTNTTEITCLFNTVQSDPDSVTDIVDSTSGSKEPAIVVNCAIPPHPAGRVQLSLGLGGIQASINTIPFTYTLTCVNGTYLTGSSCIACPENAYCLGKDYPPYAKPGFARSISSETVFLPCFEPTVCVGGPVESQCADGHTGPRCSQCVGGLHSKDGLCTDCGDESQSFLLYAAAVSVLTVLVTCFMLWSVMQPTTLAVPGILLMYLQLSGLFSTYQLKYPPYIFEFLNWMNVANIDFGSSRCLLSVSFQNKLTVLVFVPVVVLLTLLACQAYHTGFRLFRHGGVWTPSTIDSSKIFGDHCIDAAISVLNMVYIPISQQCLSLMICASDIDRSYMLAEPSMDCYALEWFALLPIAAVGVAIYTIAIPLGLLIIGRLYNDRTEDPFVIRRYGMIFRKYKDHAHRCEPYSRIYSFVIMLIPILIANYPVAIALLDIVMLVLYMTYMDKVKPFRFERCNSLARVTSCSLIVVLVAGCVTRQIEDNPLVFVLSMLMIAKFFVTYTLALHSLVFEWQILNYARLSSKKYWAWLMQSRIWHLAFPWHMTDRAINEAEERRRIPIQRHIIHQSRLFKSGIIAEHDNEAGVEARHMTKDISFGEIGGKSPKYVDTKSLIVKSVEMNELERTTSSAVNDASFDPPESIKANEITDQNVSGSNPIAEDGITITGRITTTDHESISSDQNSVRVSPSLDDGRAVEGLKDSSALE